jgi:cytochrome c peroxidase
MAPTYSEPGENVHAPAEVCTDDFQASRSPTGGYRTTPLRGVARHGQGGYWHDGRFRTLRDVVAHYNSCFGLNLSAREQSDLVEYLKSL